MVMDDTCSAVSVARSLTFVLGGERCESQDEGLSCLDDLVKSFQSKFPNGGLDAVTSADLSFLVRSEPSSLATVINSIEDISDGSLVEVVRKTTAKRKLDSNDEDASKRLKAKEETAILNATSSTSSIPQNKDCSLSASPAVKSVNATAVAAALADPTVAAPKVTVSEDFAINFVVRLRGLPYNVTEEQITEFLDDAPQSPLADSFILLKDENGRSMGEAYLRLLDESAQEAALSHHRRTIGSRYIEVFKSDDRSLQRAIGRMQGAAGTKPVGDFVVQMRGIPFTATDNEIREFFQPITLGKIHFGVGPGGRKSGCAFVEFSTESELEEAMKHDKEHMGSRYVELFRSSLLEVQKKVFYDQNQGYDSGPPSRFNEPYHRGNKNSFDSRGSYRVSGCRGGNFIRLRGLPYEVRPEDIVSFFVDIRCSPISIAFSTRPNEAFVEFISADEATRSLEKDRAYLGRRYIEIFSSNKDEVMRTAQQAPRSAVDYRGPPRDYREQRGPPQQYSGGHGPYSNGPSYGGPPPRDYCGGPQYEGQSSGGYSSYGRPPPRSHPSYSSRPPYGGSPAPHRIGAPAGYAFAQMNGYVDSPSLNGAYRLRMSGMPYRASRTDVVNFFSGIQVSEQSIELLTDDRGRPSGEAMVQFSTAADLQNAIATKNKAYMAKEHRYRGRISIT